MTHADKKLAIFSGVMDSLIVLYIVLLHRFNQILNDVPGDTFFEQAWNMMQVENAWTYFTVGLIIAVFMGVYLFYIGKHWENYTLILVLILAILLLALIITFIFAYSNPLFRAALIVILTAAGVLYACSS